MGLPLFPARMATATLGVLGLIGAMLSVTGIFGMAAYSISHRLKELGIRMALGAQRAQVLKASLSRPPIVSGSNPVTSVRSGNHPRHA